MDIDRKKLIGEAEHTITQREIDAWNAGKEDAVKDKKLKDRGKASVDEAMKIVKLYAQHGNIEYAVTRLDTTASEIRRVLSAYNINSIEDAREAVRRGVIAEYDQAVKEEREETEVARRTDRVAAVERFEASKGTTEERAKKTPDEVDAELAVRREEAQQLNKKDRLRQLMTEGLSASADTSKFRIDLSQISRFKALIPHGVSHLQRQFGGTPKEIVNEVRRLAPEVDTDMLRR